MTISIKKARDFIYQNGVLWEKALFSYLHEDGSLEHLHQCLIAYRNPDGGFGHGFEHDITTPDSNPLPLEFMLRVMLADFHIPTGTLFDGASAWLEANTQPDGYLKNPASVLDYPHAPWWNEGGQNIPDSITGNLYKIGKASPAVLKSTQAWVEKNLTVEAIQANEWLFMAYHGWDYFCNMEDCSTHREAVIQNIIDCAEKMPEAQYPVLISYAQSPDSIIAKRASHLVKRSLDYIQESQQDDGSWHDEHGLPQWFSYRTILELMSLKRHNRI